MREAMRPPPSARRFPKTFPSDQRLEANLVALRGLALPENGAGDGNRKYRWRALAFWNHEVASATGAACDFFVKNDAIRANASQCGDYLTHIAFNAPPKARQDRLLDCR
jgi:hypothetical protein